MSTTPAKLLIIDDDRFLLDMYSLKFKTGGLSIDTASSATSALTKLRNSEIYDIILLDIIMPGMDGMEFLQTVRDEKLVPQATIIMLTNQADEFEKAKALGVDGYIIKATSIPSDVVSQVINTFEAKNKKIEK